MLARALIVLALIVILGVPLILRDAPASTSRGEGPVLVIVTPHVPQIRAEFERAFVRWHQREYNEPISIDWRAPGGTSEIIKLLQGQFAARADAFDLSDPNNPTAPPGTIDFDLMFGGGSFDHGRLKRGVVVRAPGPDGTPRDTSIPMSVPAGFSQEELDAWFGENRIGAQQLYDAEQFWIGTALSSFGIVFNTDVLAALGVPEPDAFEDLADPRLAGWLILADPRQSGSITTTLDAILSNLGWERGWRVIRAMGANTRYFTASAPKPPIDISQGEAAAGLAIDFYGRGQSQAVLRRGQDPTTSRVGYVDPPGMTYVDADPASILRGARSPDLARRFIRFCLSEEGQALWQFPAIRGDRGASNPQGADGQPMGPQLAELRRMPVRRIMWDKYAAVMIDKVDPFTLATKTKPAGWRAAIGPMMGAFSIDNARFQRDAWAAMNRVRTRTQIQTDPRAADVLAKMEAEFYSWPTTPIIEADGSTTQLPFTPENLPAIVAAWRAPGRQAELEIRYTEFFREAYARVVALERTLATN